MSPAMKSYDIVIVGGGIVGSASAYYLRKHGFTGSVAIVEKDTTYQTGCTPGPAAGCASSSPRRKTSRSRFSG